MIEKLILFFKRPASKTVNEVPEGLCPNCWGRQEYDNKIRDLYDEKQIDVNNHTANYAFIQDFVINQIDGIKLVKGVSAYECPTCRSMN